jgi:hypothetical protein
MEVTFEPLQERFSTADATRPEVASKDDLLHVTFHDWQTRVVQLVFHDVAGYSWDDGDAALDSRHRDDGTYLVQNSPWLARHCELGAGAMCQNLKHFKLCFNATGVLQVLASRLEVRAEQGAAADRGNGE